MLTASQCRTVAYLTDDGVVCPDCLKPCEANAELTEANREVSAYEADELAGDDGLYCERCNTELVEPSPRCETCEELVYDCTCGTDPDDYDPDTAGDDD